MPTITGIPMPSERPRISGKLSKESNESNQKRSPGI